ncbi:hypothetical protein DFH08DRAFT_807292 [Mycena albidolilacea]|uniref:Uncharacterized protein n=1 Tax=Mycena albidolilacea TaxID=1033008 RepID=A0AAD7A5K2_9AGAR|nr:hypothetical protein DFH08DRAFT_807292 [Mycena albidolilacea]
MSSQQSQQSRNTCISHEMSTDSLNEWITRLQDEIKEHMESIFAGMLQEVVEQANNDPEYLRYLRDLIELEGEVDVEVAVADTNLCTVQDDMLEATARRDQIAELHQRFEQGDIQPMHYVDSVNLLRRQVSPDVDDVPDKKLDSGDESEGGEEAEEPEEVGKKQKSKGKAKVVPKKAKKEHEEQDGSYLRPQSATHLPQVKGPRIAEAMAELGQEDAVVHRPVSKVSSRCRQVDSCSSEMMLGEISYLEEMRLSLVNTQHRLRELKQREKEHKLKKQRKRAAQTAGNQPQKDTGPTRSETSTERTGRLLSCATRLSSRSARSRSRTGFALLSSDEPVVPLMTIKQEHEDANTAALGTITEQGLERVARKAERREQIARENAERTERAERDRPE